MIKEKSLNRQDFPLEKLYSFDGRFISVSELEDMIEKVEILHQCLSIAHSLAMDEKYSRDDAINDLLRLFKEHTF